MSCGGRYSARNSQDPTPGLAPSREALTTSTVGIEGISAAWTASCGPLDWLPAGRTANPNSWWKAADRGDLRGGGERGRPRGPWGVRQEVERPSDNDQDPSDQERGEPERATNHGERTGRDRRCPLARPHRVFRPEGVGKRGAERHTESGRGGIEERRRREAPRGTECREDLIILRETRDAQSEEDEPDDVEDPGGPERGASPFFRLGHRFSHPQSRGSNPGSAPSLRTEVRT